jgi:hypothetical protein
VCLPGEAEKGVDNKQTHFGAEATLYLLGADCKIDYFCPSNDLTQFEPQLRQTLSLSNADAFLLM